MKKLLQVISFSVLFILCFMDYHKNPMNSPRPVNTGKGCRVMDYSDSASSVVAGIVRHFHFQYNDLDQLVFFGAESVFHYEVSYDAPGRISKINHFDLGCKNVCIN